MSNYSTIPGFWSVITLGHMVKQPLIRPPSELADGSEPHGLFTPSVRTACTGRVDPWREEVYPGWRELGGYREGGIPGNPPSWSSGRFDAYL